MKKKLLILITILLVSVFALAACSAKGDGADNYAPGESPSVGDVPEEETGPNVSARKIIYKADASVYTDDLDATVAAIRGALDKSEGEWFDNENISDGYAYFKARVKSGRLDEFLSAVSAGGTIKNLNKTATDVSLEYHDTQNRLESLQAEYDRLTELKSSAGMYELLQIEQRQSQINYQIISLQGNLNKYESLLEYSEITLNVYAKPVPTEKAAFGERLSKVFKGAWNALRTFLEWLLIAVTAIFPFAVVFVPVGAGVTVLVIFLKKRKAKKQAGFLPPAPLAPEANGNADEAKKE